MHEAGHAEVLGVDDLVCAWGVEDGLGVDARLVVESRVASDVVVEGNIDLDS